ncbi:MAG: shikimate dehydrogenase [Microbacterium sp.]
MSEGRLEVWGDPIDHSLSPVLHAAAYAELGWDWAYGRRRVAERAFSGELAEHGPRLRGLSLTFPLKAVAFDAAATRHHAAELTGAVNTLLLTGPEPRGFNTDVEGLAADLRDAGASGIERARIVGAGATATSALVALARLGAKEIDVVARRPEAARHLADLGGQLGVTVSAYAFGTTPEASAPLTVSTLPGGAEIALDDARRLAAVGGLLYDVVYGHWPTTLAGVWLAEGGTAVGGLGMLLQQAVRQIRVFSTGDPLEPLPREEAVVEVMRRALVGG